MNKEQLTARLAELEKGRTQAIANAQQWQANVNAFNGAISEAKFWLEQIDQKDVPAIPIEDLIAKAEA